MELQINLKGQRDLTKQIIAHIREAIFQGQLIPGTQLPPTRSLAQQLGVSRKTIAEAYARLTYDNLLVGRVGSGTFVNRPAPEPRPQPKGEVLAGARVIERWQGPNLATQHLQRFDYLAGATNKNQFPHNEWRRCVLFGLRQIAQSGGMYSQPQGIAMLRDAIARHIVFARGVRCSSDDLLVTQGAQQGLDLVARVLVEPGCIVAMEDPGYLPARQLLEAQGAHVVGIAVDEQGMQVERIPDGTRLIYVTPAHQFPLGMTMSQVRRQALLLRARALGAIIVEDDYDSEFNYEGRPVDCLQSMDRFGVVAYLGTFSKTLLPELRLGYLVAPRTLLGALMRAKQLTDWHSSTLTQWALAKFILDGCLIKHIRRCHGAYSSRRARLIERLDGDLSPWFKRLPSTTGFHLAAFGKNTLDIKLLTELAKKAEVGLHPLAPFYHSAAPRSGLLLGFGAIETLDIETSLERLKGILKSF